MRNLASHLRCCFSLPRPLKRRRYIRDPRASVEDWINAVAAGGGEFCERQLKVPPVNSVRDVNDDKQWQVVSV
jgi:hypothetical protein